MTQQKALHIQRMSGLFNHPEFPFFLQSMIEGTYPLSSEFSRDSSVYYQQGRADAYKDLLTEVEAISPEVFRRAWNIWLDSRKPVNKGDEDA